MNIFSIRRYILRLFGIASYPSVKELRKKGIRIGDNVDIIRSYVDDLFPELINIGSNVTITNATILVHDASMNKFIGGVKFAPVTIGNNVFIGYGAIILPGVTIGSNVIIGAGSVISRNIPDNTVVVGHGVVVNNIESYLAKFDNYKERFTDAMPHQLTREERFGIISKIGSGNKNGEWFLK